jgi:hypothetical protein
VKDSAANVTSIDAMRQMRTALLRFDDESRQALTLLSLEVRRAIDWIEVDRMQYWPVQVRRAGEAVIQARNDLERCQLKYGSEEAPPCYEQKKGLERAKRRARLCDEKLRATKRWVRSIRQELSEFDGQMAKMNNCLDSDLPRAVAALERMIGALDEYTAAEQPGRSTVAQPQVTNVDLDSGGAER